MQLWLVRKGSVVYICSAKSREGAKKAASRALVGDTDHAIVTPLTTPQDIVMLHVILQEAE